MTAVWAIGNAVVGTGTGTRVAKSAAEGIARVHFQKSEIVVSLVAAIGTSAYIGNLRESLVEGVIAGVCMISFIAAEASTSFEIGLGRFNRYLCLLALRALLPPALLAVLFVSSTASFIGAMLCVLAGNLASLLLWPNRFSGRLDRSKDSTGHSVGAINMGLWVIASADRLVLEPLVSPLNLASYALAYGLADRVYRSLSNAYIARTLGKAFAGTAGPTRLRFYGLTFVLTILIVPAVQVGSNLLSGGRYDVSPLMTVAITLSGLFMVWAAPAYVKIMTSNDFTYTLVAVFVLATVNVIGNIAFSGAYGTISAAIISLLTYVAWFAWLTFYSRRDISTKMDGARHLRVLKSYAQI
ncbi:hypothetical protein [Pseudarthrobacter sp. NPDC058119]|uniref:hypothetical protein n=1 Tax=Pseudarthrobacter sp. NPDC058119 TaxID=3346348 RepID=UPI0036DE4154